MTTKADGIKDELRFGDQINSRMAAEPSGRVGESVSTSYVKAQFSNVREPQYRRPESTVTSRQRHILFGILQIDLTSAEILEASHNGLLLISQFMTPLEVPPLMTAFAMVGTDLEVLSASVTCKGAEISVWKRPMNTWPAQIQIGWVVEELGAEFPASNVQNDYDLVLFADWQIQKFLSGAPTPYEASADVAAFHGPRISSRYATSADGFERPFSLRSLRPGARIKACV